MACGRGLGVDTLFDMDFSGLRMGLVFETEPRGRRGWLSAARLRIRLGSVVAVKLPDTGAHVAGAGGEDAACG